MVAIAVVALVLLDAFETIVLPRRVPGRFRLTFLFYAATLDPLMALARRLPDGTRRETWLSFFGPLSLIVLLGVWAVGLILAYALLQWGLETNMVGPEGPAGFGAIVYMSGVTFLTLGFGDVTPHDELGRLLAVLEAGMGFGFLALVIGYLPVLYQAFSRREVNVAMLDARAGSPPIAAELLRREGESGNLVALHELLKDWERWAAELLESHVSYPVLMLYRSQHERQSWLAALTLILDVSALTAAGIAHDCARQARLTFAMARHAAVDLCQIMDVDPEQPCPDRLPAEDLTVLYQTLEDAGIPLRPRATMEASLTKLRDLYEPYVWAIGDYLLMPLPAWLPPAERSDDWQSSAWKRTGGRVFD
jgi:hypothetical protein